MKPHIPQQSKPSHSQHGKKSGRNIISSDSGSQHEHLDDKRPHNLDIPTSMTSPNGGSVSPTFHTSQILGHGRSRVLLCVDNDDSTVQGGDHPLEDTSLFSMSEDSVVEAARNITAQLEEVKPKIPRKTMMKQRFTFLKNQMPQYKLDKEMKRSIVSTMVDLNYWSEGSDDDALFEEDEDRRAKTPFSERRSDKKKESHSESQKTISDNQNTSQGPETVTEPQTNVPEEIVVESVQPHPPTTSGKKPVDPRKSVKIYHSSGKQQQTSQDELETPKPTKSQKKVIILDPRANKKAPGGNAANQTQQSQPQSQHQPHTIQELAEPVEVKQKVPLVKPKQIQIAEPVQQKMEKYGKQALLDRNRIRDTIINKAVQIFIKVENEQINTKEVKIQSLMKEKHEKQNNLLKRFAFGLVEKAMKKSKIITKEKLEKRKEHQLFKLQKKIRCGYKIFKCWQKSRIRRYCYLLLTAGKQILIEKSLMEEREKDAYRLRIAQRRVKEDKEFREKRNEQKYELKKQLKYSRLNSPDGKKSFQQHQQQQQQHNQTSIEMKPTDDLDYHYNSFPFKDLISPRLPSTSPTPAATSSITQSITVPVVPPLAADTSITSSKQNITNPPEMTTGYVISPRTYASRLRARQQEKNSVRQNSNNHEDERENVSDISDSELQRKPEKVLTADEQLLSEDPKYTRPDLAPFSTAINNMIKDYLISSDMNGEVIKPRPLDSVIFGEVPFTSILSAKFMNPSHPKRIRESVPQSPNKLFLSTSFDANPSTTAASFSQPVSTSASFTREFSMRMSIGKTDLRSSYGNVTTPNSVPKLMKWESDADVTKIPSLQAMKSERKYKTPAFMALEKLSKLTEKDIHSVRREVREKDILNEIIKQRGNQTSHLIFL